MKLLLLLLLYPCLLFSKSIITHKKDECSPISLHARDTSTSNHFSKATNQGSQGWCHSYVLADLLSWEFQKPLSAVHIGLLYSEGISETMLVNKFWPKRNGGENKKKYGEFSGGTLNGALKAAKKSAGICSENDLNSTLDIYRETHPYKAIQERIEQIRRYDQDFYKGTDLTCIEGFDFGTLATQGKIDSMLGSITNHEINLEIYKNLDMNPRKLLMRIVDKGCQEKVDINSVELVFTNKKYSRSTGKKKSYSRKKSNLIKRINENLEKNKPSGLTYNSNHIKKKEYRSILRAGHFSSITGRRWNPSTKTCEFKIRNSWGESCQSYMPTINCNAKEGSFWVDEKNLHKMAEQVSHIERKR